jgi:hypothetical protein
MSRRAKALLVTFIRTCNNKKAEKADQRGKSSGDDNNHLSSLFWVAERVEKAERAENFFWAAERRGQNLQKGWKGRKRWINMASQVEMKTTF